LYGKKTKKTPNSGARGGGGELFGGGVRARRRGDEKTIGVQLVVHGRAGDAVALSGAAEEFTEGRVGEFIAPVGGARAGVFRERERGV